MGSADLQQNYQGALNGTLRPGDSSLLFAQAIGNNEARGILASHQFAQTKTSNHITLSHYHSCNHIEM